MKLTKNNLLIFGVFVLVIIGIGLFLGVKKKPLETKPLEEKTTKTEEEKQVCIEGLSWGFRGVDYKMTGWENHELQGKNRKFCCGISKDYNGTVYKACVYDEEYILWVKSPQTNNEFRKETVGYRKDGQFCKVSYDYYNPGENIISEDCYSEED